MSRLRLIRAAAWTVACVLAFGASACVKERLPVRGSLTALVLLNYQVDYLRVNGRMPVAQDQVGGLIKATNKMIAAMRQQPSPVIYTINEFSPFEPVSDFGQDFSALRFESGSTLDKRINYLGGVYFSNDDWDAFANPQFGEHLQLIGAGRLVLAGTYPERSVVETARQAKRRGYAVTVISDAVASSDTHRRERALQELRQAGIEIETSDQFIAGLGQESKS
jgi:nicotinamidase-related amidase